MTKIFNWVFGSFFRTLGRVFVYILLGFVLFNFLNLKDIKLPTFTDLLFMNVSAETFTQDSRFTYYLYRNSDTPLESGTGLLDSYGGSGFNRVQFLYQLYTFDSKYLYDITFTTYFSGTGGTGVLTANNWADSCSIYTGTGSQYNCSYTGGYDGNIAYMRSSINNMVGTDVSTLWLNFYSNGVAAVNFIQSSYELEINRKENKNVTSENLQNATDSIINSQNNNANNIINNQNSNSQSIIDNQNQNKTDIINNQNSNTDKTINSQKVCTYIDKNICSYDNKIINTFGEIVSTGGTNECATDYINIEKSTIELITNTSTYSGYTCFYNINKTLIRCIYNINLVVGNITIPTNASYMRTSIVKSENKPTFNVCKNGNQAMTDSINDMNSSINNSDITGASSDASNFFSNFTTDTHGLTGIITAPLNAINNLTNQTCSPLVLPLPFINQNLTLPCMRDIYEEHFGSFMTLYDLITLGIVSYWVMVRIFSLVKDFKNPEHDEIEVVDL